MNVLERALRDLQEQLEWQEETTIDGEYKNGLLKGIRICIDTVEIIHKVESKKPWYKRIRW